MTEINSYAFDMTFLTKYVHVSHIRYTFSLFLAFLLLKLIEMFDFPQLVNLIKSSWQNNDRSSISLISNRYIYPLGNLPSQPRHGIYWHGGLMWHEQPIKHCLHSAISFKHSVRDVLMNMALSKPQKLTTEKKCIDHIYCTTAMRRRYNTFPGE